MAVDYRKKYASSLMSMSDAQFAQAQKQSSMKLGWGLDWGKDLFQAEVERRNKIKAEKTRLDADVKGAASRQLTGRAANILTGGLKNPGEAVPLARRMLMGA